MFGMNQQAKVPNSSQYDFKGAAVPYFPFRSSLPPVPTSQPHREQATSAASQDQAQLAAHSPTRASASATSCKTRPTSWREPNTGLPSLPKTPITPRKTSRSWRRKSTIYSRSAPTSRSQVAHAQFRSESGRAREGEVSYKQGEEFEKTARGWEYC